MLTKSFEVEVKADNGYIEGYFSTFTREPDAVGDVVAKGAFLESFAKINANGGTIPFLWNHDSENLDSYIGIASNFGEDDHGAYFRASFDDTETAQRARQLAMDGRLCKFSFAYDVQESAPVMLDDGRKANELRKLDVHEVSLVMYPANRDTSVTEVKSEEKSGRRNSAKDESELQRIAELSAQINEVVNGLLAVDEPTAVGEEEREEDSEGAKSQAEFVGAYKSAVKTLLGV